MSQKHYWKLSNGLWVEVEVVLMMQSNDNYLANEFEKIKNLE